MAHWKPFRGSLSLPAFARIRLIYSYFSGLRQSEKRETGLSALLKRLMISHTHLKTSYLPDTTPLIKRPESWLPSSSCGTAPGLAGPRAPLKPHALRHAAVWKASSSMPGCDWHPRSSANSSHVLQGKKKLKYLVDVNINVMQFEASLKLLPLHCVRFSARLILGWPAIWELGVFLNLFHLWSHSCRKGDHQGWKCPASSSTQDLVLHLQFHFHALDFVVALKWGQQRNNPSFLSLTHLSGIVSWFAPFCSVPAQAKLSPFF